MKLMRRVFTYLFGLFVGYHMGGSYVVAKRIVPYNVHMGMDVAKLSYGLYRYCRSPLEFYGSISFYPILLEWDYGVDDCYFGKYVKLGLGYNFIKPTKHANQFSIGARYAMSLGRGSSRNWGEPARVNHKIRGAVPCERRVMARWLEWVVCAKVSLVPFVYIGNSLRFKVAKIVTGHAPAYLPGWGSADSRLGYDYNFYIGFVIPFKKILN